MTPSSYILQLWILPALNFKEMGLPSILEVEGNINIRIREVIFEPGLDTALPNNAKPLFALLLEMDGLGDSIDSTCGEEFAKLGNVMERLSFGFLKSFHSIAARIVPKGLKVGDCYSAVEYRPGPPGISPQLVFPAQSSQVCLDISFLGRDISPAVEGAIHWLLTGINEGNPIRQVMYFWVGLEMLAPVVQQPMRCPKCAESFPKCPACKEDTSGPAATKTVMGYLVDALGISKKEARSLYYARNEVAHGKVAITKDGVEKMCMPSNQLRELLLSAIKKSLVMKENLPPLISTPGLIHNLCFKTNSSVVKTADFYDRPVARSPITSIDGWGKKTLWNV